MMEDAGGSMRWLMGRLPRGATWPDRANAGVAIWERGERRLLLRFGTPHAVEFEQACGRMLRVGTLNLAMNLQEITDLILWVGDGRERWRHETDATNPATTCPR